MTNSHKLPDKHGDQHSYDVSALMTQDVSVCNVKSQVERIEKSYMKAVIKQINGKKCDKVICNM